MQEWIPMQEWQTNADRWYFYYNVFRKEGLSPETSQRLANVQIEKQNNTFCGNDGICQFFTRREVEKNASVESKASK